MSAPLTLYEAIRETAGRRKDALALVFKDASVSFTELLRRIDEAADALSTIGIGYGSTFAIYAQNCPELMYGYFAASKIGARFVQINPNMTAIEVQHIFTHSDATILLHDALVAEQASTAVRSAQRLELRQLFAPTSSARRFAEPSHAIKRVDPFLIIYTSGSTGLPKAVVLSQAAQVDVCGALNEFWGVSERDVTLVALPLGYLYGLSTAAAAGLLAGGTIVVMPKFRPADVLQALSAFRATVFHGVPTMFSMMLEYAEKCGKAFDLSFVRQMITAGSPLPEEVVRRFEESFRSPLKNYYAMTECTPVFGAYAGDLAPVPPGAVGRKAPGVSIRIVGPDGRECPVGVDGEFLVRAAATLSCYYKDPELTAASTHEGMFRSGDLGHCDDRGYYYITGRIKDTIIRGGANIAPAEVEAVLSRHRAVQDVCVVGAPDKVFGEVPVAFVVKRPHSDVTAEELIHHAESVLADFKVPRQYAFEESLPLGKTGKVDKIALRAKWRQRNP